MRTPPVLPPALPQIKESLDTGELASANYDGEAALAIDQMLGALIGRIRGQVTCGHCGNVSATQQDFTHVSLDLPTTVDRHGITLEELLLGFFSPEPLEGDVYRYAFVPLALL
jgi:ubiquitin C-terminal hydrolase